MKTTKKHWNYSVAFALLGTLFACQNEVIDEPTQKQDDEKIETLLIYQEIAKRPQLSKEEALKLANEVVSIYPTRSNNARRVKSIDCVISSPRTRSEHNEVDTTHYIINYADNEGFLLLSGDKRIMPILGYSETGNLDWNNTPKEIGLYAYKHMLPTIEEQERQEFEQDLKQLQQEVGSIAHHGTRGTTPSPYHETSGLSAKLISEVKPLVKVEWGQGQPYNFYANQMINETTKKYQNAALGCGPLAIAMAMSVYKHPKSIGGKTINWDKFVEMKNVWYRYDNLYTEDEFALFRFLRVVADSTSAGWGLDGTSIHPDSVPICLKSLGYSSASNYTYKFSPSDLIQMLKQGNPVLIGGANEELNKGHMWVCDGYKNYQLTRWSGGRQLLARRFRQIFHCNWGWYGRANGYFYFGNFMPFKSRVEDITKGFFVEDSTDIKDYSFQNYIYPGIKP